MTDDVYAALQVCRLKHQAVKALICALVLVMNAKQLLRISSAPPLSGALSKSVSSCET